MFDHFLNTRCYKVDNGLGKCEKIAFTWEYVFIFKRNIHWNFRLCRRSWYITDPVRTDFEIRIILIKHCIKLLIRNDMRNSYLEVSFFFNPLSANITKWSNTLKQFVGKLPTNCLSVFDHFVELALKGLT